MEKTKMADLIKGAFCIINDAWERCESSIEYIDFETIKILGEWVKNGYYEK